jgi:hypothetical protein
MVMAEVAIGISAVRTPAGSSHLIGFSAGQIFPRDREADDEASWLPVPGDFASKARNRGANEKITKPLVRRRYDFGSSALCPGNEEGLSLVHTLDSDSPGRSRKRAIFCGVCRELVQQQRQAGNHGRIDFHIASGDGEF